MTPGCLGLCCGTAFKLQPEQTKIPELQASCSSFCMFLSAILGGLFFPRRDSKESFVCSGVLPVDLLMGVPQEGRSSCPGQLANPTERRLGPGEEAPQEAGRRTMSLGLGHWAKRLGAVKRFDFGHPVSWPFLPVPAPF